MHLILVHGQAFFKRREMPVKKTNIIASAVVFMILTACAQKGPVLLSNISYQPPEGIKATSSKVVIGVSPLKDSREKSASVVGRRVIASTDIINDLVVQGTAADMVTERLKDALQARGFKVKDVAAWDMTAEGLKPEGVDLVIGGEVKSLWVESSSKPLDTTMKADVQLRVAAADVSEKKIIRTLNLASRLEQKDIAFSFDKVEAVLSEALSSAIDQIFSDEEMKKRLE